MPYLDLQQIVDLAMQHHRAGDLRGAERLYRQILSQKPNQPDALHLLGVLSADTGRTQEGIALIRQALSLAPSAAEVWSNLGVILTREGRTNEAVEAFRQSIRLRPHVISDFNNLGNALQQAGRAGEAIAAYRTAMSNRDRMAEAQRPHPADWELRASDNLLILLHHDPANDAKAIFADHALWNRLYAAPLAPSIQKHDNERNPDKRLRVGFVSAYLSSYPVGRFISGLLREHDRERFEVFCYSDLREPDATTRALSDWSAQWRDTAALDDGQLAELIHRDGIDLLVDLGMHTRGNRMRAFARRPAPVQITYLAYCGTTGLQTIDYRLSDPYLDPDDSDQPYYSEQTVRLRSYWCYPPPHQAPEVNEPPSAAAGAEITFGCLNDFGKVNPTTISLWSEVLRSVPRGRLLLHAPTDANRQRASQWFQAEGIEQRRIGFTDMLPMPEYLRQYHRIDIALDPTPWCGGTTTCDSLWMGVPVVSLTGGTAISRGGLSILSQIGLPELVASTPREYARIASSLAHDPPRLASLRRALRDRMRASALMDAPGFARDFESILRRIWRRWCEPAASGLS